MTEYITTRKECEDRIHGVCEGCGDELSAIETVDNSGHPTFWQGCEHCHSFRSGIDEKYFKVARKLVEEGRLLPYSHLKKFDYQDTPERLEYYLDSQTAGLSHEIEHVHGLLGKVLEHRGGVRIGK